MLVDDGTNRSVKVLVSVPNLEVEVIEIVDEPEGTTTGRVFVMNVFGEISLRGKVQTVAIGISDGVFVKSGFRAILVDMAVPAKLDLLTVFAHRRLSEKTLLYGFILGQSEPSMNMLRNCGKQTT